MEKLGNIKKSNIGMKLLKILGVLIVIIGITFWREIYQGILYADICRKYMFWQEQIIDRGSYKLIVQAGTDSIYYCNAEKTIAEHYDSTKTLSSKRVTYQESDMPNTQLEYLYSNQEDERLVEANLKIYSPAINMYKEEYQKPYTPLIGFEKIKFWDLMKTFKDIISIRIAHHDENDYYVLYFGYGQEIWINKETGLIERDGYANYVLDIWTDIEENLIYPDNEEYVILADYEMENRSKEETNIKISNCEEEAGTIVNYDFKVPNGGNTSLYGFFKTYDENLRIMKIMNYDTYKELQERWEGLRDLTVEDFEHYFVMVIANTDNTREIEFKQLTTSDTPSELAEKNIHVTEKEAQGEFMYSGNLLIIPNSMDTKASGATIFAYGVTVES